jgi:hypothetical protein
MGRANTMGSKTDRSRRIRFDRAAQRWTTEQLRARGI